MPALPPPVQYNLLVIRGTTEESNIYLSHKKDRYESQAHKKCSKKTRNNANIHHQKTMWLTCN